MQAWNITLHICECFLKMLKKIRTCTVLRTGGDVVESGTSALGNGRVTRSFTSSVKRRSDKFRFNMGKLPSSWSLANRGSSGTSDWSSCRITETYTTLYYINRMKLWPYIELTNITKRRNRKLIRSKQQPNKSIRKKFQQLTLTRFY